MLTHAIASNVRECHIIAHPHRVGAIYKIYIGSCNLETKNHLINLRGTGRRSELKKKVVLLFENIRHIACVRTYTCMYVPTSNKTIAC